MIVLFIETTTYKKKKFAIGNMSKSLSWLTATNGKNVKQTFVAGAKHEITCIIQLLLFYGFVSY